MSFYDVVSKLSFPRLRATIDGISPDQVARTLAKNHLSIDDLPVLVSEAASGFVEEMGGRAKRLTQMRFGRVVNLYAPLYLSNECTNTCVYCGFSAKSGVARKNLCLDEAVSNARSLAEEGFGHILLVTGEHPRRYGVEQIAEVVQGIGDIFHSISIEVFPMEEGDYRRLEGLGVDGLTLYQETYDTEVYARVHPSGKKRDYRYRLEGPERGGAAGFRTLGLGSLLGLTDWRLEALVLGLHAAYLGKHCWRSRVAVSFPRIVPSETGFSPPHPVSDQEMIQMMAALRCVLPDAEMVVSTREPASLRDQMVGLGVTRMSAGSVTSPGGYVTREAGEQFQVVDGRSAAQVATMLEGRGFEPVWKDFDRLMRGDAAPDAPLEEN